MNEPNTATSEEHSFWFNARTRLILWAMAKTFPNPRSILEIGCETGLVLQAIDRKFPHARIVGADSSTERLAVARHRVPRAELVPMPIAPVPFESEFEVIGAFDVLEHVDDDLGALQSFHRALEPGGGLILTVPQHPKLWSPLDEKVGHFRRYTAAQLHERLRRADFEIVISTSFVSLLLPVMLAKRRLSPRRHQATAITEVVLPRLIDAPLSAVLAVERWLTRAGVRFPIGGTRLVVARANRDGALSQRRSHS